MEIQRAIKIRIDVDSSIISEFITLYTSACNYVSEVAFQEGLSNRRKLHDICYPNIRAAFKLPAQVACSVMTDVAAKYQALRTTAQWPPQESIRFHAQPVLL